jgi:hypothetical protein
METKFDSNPCENGHDYPEAKEGFQCRRCGKWFGGCRPLNREEKDDLIAFTHKNINQIKKVLEVI